MVKLTKNESIFTTLARGFNVLDIPSRTRESMTWFRKETENLRLTPKLMLANNTDKYRARPFIGHMYMFVYDPKTKKTLPYYDQFPLIFVISKYKDGFLGINLHYLPPRYRAILLKKLYTVISDKRFNDRTKLKISYDILRSTPRYREFMPCVKRYLTGHVRSKFMKIDAVDWEKAIFLPVERFVKASKTRVWRDSINKLGKID